MIFIIGMAIPDYADFFLGRSKTFRFVINQGQSRTVTKQFSNLSSYLSTFKYVVKPHIGQMSPFSSRKIEFIPWEVTVPLAGHFHSFPIGSTGKNFHKQNSTPFCSL